MLAWYIAPPTLVALINPHKGKFNVTAKGGLVEGSVRRLGDLAALHLPCPAQPGGRCGRHLALLLWPANRDAHRGRQSVVSVVLYNLIVLGGAVAVSVESKQVRRSHRVEMTMPAAIAREDGHLFSCTVQDFSDGGLEIRSTVRRRFWKGRK